MREKPKYGPTRGEMIFRTGFSAVGLAMLLGILVFQGIPSGPAFFEVVIIGAGFFGGSFGWSLWCLAKGCYRDG